MTFKALGVTGIWIGLLTVPALAHHSFVMFERELTIELSGTVKELQLTNPHSWLQVMVADDAGEMVEWSLEMNAPGNLADKGWEPRTVVPGDEVTVILHPLRDGTPGGQLITVELPDGSAMLVYGTERRSLRTGNAP